MKILPENVDQLMGFANDADSFSTPVLPANDVAPGRFSLCNEERFTAAYYSEPLTSYATGWTDSENIQALLDCASPRVPVGRRFEFKQAVNAEAFLSEQDDDRAIGANFKQIEYRGLSVSSKTNNRGLMYRLDLDEEGAGILTEELIVARILQRLRRNQYRRAVTLLIAQANNTNVTWSSGSPSPDEDIRQAVQRAQASSGVFPNRGICDLKAWNNRKKGMNPQFTAGTLAAYQWTPDDVAADQMLDEFMLSKPVYQSSASAKTYITNNLLFIFIGQDAPTRDDPTTLKRFVTPVGDGDFRVYRQPVGAKFVDISVEYYDNIVATSAVGLGCESLTVS
jgi:hypothetical protein